MTINRDESNCSPRWSWKQFRIAASLILFGVVSWFVCLALASGGGTPGGPPYWMQHYVEKFYSVAPLVSLAGALWVIVMLIRLIPTTIKKNP